MRFRRPGVLGILTLILAIPLAVWSGGLGSEFAILPLAAVNGPQKTLLILAQFSDKPNSTSPSQISSDLTNLNNYYREDSYGTVSFQTDTTPTSGQWYVLPNTMTWYGTDTISSDNALIHDAIQKAYDAGSNIGSYKFAIIVHAGTDEAMTHATSDIHSFTIPGFVFSPSPLTSYTISSSVVSEQDPMGVFAHECGHLLGLPDLYDLTQRIDPANNFVGYWEIMALGEWNPNTAGIGSPAPGTYPSHHSIWSKIQLGFVSNILTVNPGESKNVTIQNLESPTSGTQGVRIPIAFDSNGKASYYLLEMRAKLGTYDQYLPFATGYPNAGLLIYKVNESIPNGQGSVKLIDAHLGGDLSDAPFGPCFAPCVSENSFSDQPNYVKVIVTTTTPTAYNVTIDRTNSPVLLLQVNTPASGILVSIDGVNTTTDSSRQVRTIVHYGPHTVYVQPQIPVIIGSTTVTVGLANSFSSWDDGNSQNPRGFSIITDTVITATYRITPLPSGEVAIGALGILAVAAVALILHRRKKHSKSSVMQPQAVPIPTFQQAPPAGQPQP